VYYVVLQIVLGCCTKREETRVKKLTGTLREATHYTGLSRRHLYSLIGSGRLASVKVDKRRLVIWKSLEQVVSGAPKKAK
jgi:excisionase family DNA binding protein